MSFYFRFPSACKVHMDCVFQPHGWKLQLAISSRQFHPSLEQDSMGPQAWLQKLVPASTGCVRVCARTRVVCVCIKAYPEGLNGSRTPVRVASLHPILHEGAEVTQLRSGSRFPAPTLLPCPCPCRGPPGRLQEGAFG